MNINRERIYFFKKSEVNFEDEWIEFVWTLFPGLILLLLGLPTIELLYNIEIQNSHTISLKIIGNQWFWSYDYGNFENLKFDSFIIPYSDLIIGNLRLLEVDNAAVLPFDNTIICIITSNDVIHRWAIPSLNVKYDANPGRLNSFYLYSKIPGVFYGQCSEICGANHSFIPIKIEFVSSLIFKNWCISFNT